MSNLIFKSQNFQSNNQIDQLKPNLILSAITMEPLTDSKPKPLDSKSDGTIAEETKQASTTVDTDDWKRKESWDWTHFFTVPLNFPEFKLQFEELIELINKEFGEEYKKNFQGPNIVHLSLVQMKLNPERKKKLLEIIPKLERKISERFQDQTNKMEFDELAMFSFGKGSGVLYLEVIENKLIDNLNALTHELCEFLLAEKVIDQNDIKTSHITYDKKLSRYVMDQFHITLMKSSFSRGKKDHKDLKPVLEKFKEHKWKPVVVDHIDLSIRGEYTPDGYYLPLKTFKF